MSIFKRPVEAQVNVSTSPADPLDTQSVQPNSWTNEYFARTSEGPSSFVPESAPCLYCIVQASFTNTAPLYLFSTGLTLFPGQALVLNIDNPATIGTIQGFDVGDSVNIIRFERI